MKNRKAFYYNLIILVVAFLSAWLTVFGVNSSITVKADSGDFYGYSDTLESSNYCEINNSVYINPTKVTLDLLNEYATENTWDTLIFKLNKPICSGYYVFELSCRINSTDATAEDKFLFYDNSLSYNTDNKIKLSCNNSSNPDMLLGVKIRNDFQYIQVDVPFKSYSSKGKPENTLVEYINLKICSPINDRYSLDTELVYVVKGTSENGKWGGSGDGSYCLDLSGYENLATVVDSIDTLRDGKLKYNNLVIKTFISGTLDYTTTKYPFVFNPKTNEIYFKNNYYNTLNEVVNSYTSDLSIEPHEYRDYDNPTEVCQYTQYLYNFSGFDNELTEDTNYSEDIILTAIYEEIPKIEYNVNFYGVNNELVYSSKITRFQNGIVDVSSLTLGNIYFKANETAKNFYYNYEFIEWETPYVDETINSNLSIYGVFNKLDILEKCIINVYDETGNCQGTFELPIGTALKELNYKIPEKENYVCDGWQTRINENTVDIFGFNYCVEQSEMNIAPHYKLDQALVIIKTFSYNNNFNSETLVNGRYKIGSTLVLPKIKYYKNFTPVGFNDFRGYLESGIKRITIPEINSGEVYRIELVYEFNSNSIVENCYQLFDSSGVTDGNINNNKPTVPDADLDINPPVETERLWIEKNWPYIVAGVAALIFITVIIILTRRYKGE